MDAWSATPKTRPFWSLRILNTPIRCRNSTLQAGLVQRYACLERYAKKPHFVALCSANTPILGVQKHLFLAPAVQKHGRLRRHPRTQAIFFDTVQHTHARYPQKPLLAWGMGYIGIGVWGATPEPKEYFLASCSSNTPILGIQKPPLLAYGKRKCVRLGCHPRPQTIFCGIDHCNHPYLRYPKIPFLAHGVQKYGCLGRRPGTQTIFFGIIHFQHPHPR